MRGERGLTLLTVLIVLAIIFLAILILEHVRVS